MDPELLVQRADRALYRAKGGGPFLYLLFRVRDGCLRGTPCRYRERATRRVAVKIIVTYYQLVVDLKSKRVVGFEALARWRSDKFGWIAPDLFITVAEEIGIISELGDQPLRQACLDAGAWPRDLT